MISLTAADSAPSFDNPLEMLHACHGKILQQCDTLRKLVTHLPSAGCDEQAQQAAQSILRYFDSAGQFHHQDEEEDLFPALRKAAGSDKSHLENLLERLLQEHVAMSDAWESLRPALLQVAQGAQVTLAPALSEDFINRYAQHIAVEESELLPLATRLLDAEQMRKLGKHMAERRGARFISAN
jgi:hemerythrin-like domain-containing protein